MPRIPPTELRKLTPDQVAEIRGLWIAGGWSFKELAARYFVSDANISLVVHGKSWIGVAAKPMPRRVDVAAALEMARAGLAAIHGSLAAEHQGVGRWP
jgi:hypothetical protein